MNDNNKELIRNHRKRGKSYSEIAIELGISKNTIKSYCRRNNLGSEKNSEENIAKNIYLYCKQCGKSLIQARKGQVKKFCSDECRRLWWKENTNEYNKKAFYILVCNNCKNRFESYGNKNRKYCSHACYIKYRFKKESVF